MAVLHVRELNEAVTRALGLDPSRVRSVTLKFSHAAVECEVAQFVSDEQGQGITEVLKRYRLVEREGA